MILFLTITTILFGCIAVFLSYLLDKSKHVEIEKEELNIFMIHELRSPLSSIKSASSLLLMKTNELDVEKEQVMLKLIHSEALQLLEYVSLLLDTARLQSGMFELKKRQNDIKETITDRIKLLEPLAKEKHIEMPIIVREPIPPFKYDTEYISHAIDNLLYNALKFTPENGTITVIAAFEGKFVTISVQDSGDGMSDEQKEKLFQKFSHVGPRVPNSSGLGLYFVKSIVEAHGGHMSVSSALNAGSTFSFSLPFIED